MSGNVGRLIRAQKDYDLCNLLRSAPPAERNYGQYRVLCFRRQCLDAICQRRVDKSGGDGIYSDALSCILQCC